MRLVTGALALIAILVGGAPAGAQSNEVRQAIEEANKRFVDAFNSGDIDGVASNYAEDAILLPPNTDRIEGRDAIADFWRELAQTQVSDLELTTGQVEAAGGLAYEVGDFALQAGEQGGEPQAIEGKYVVVWKQTGSAWKMQVDIWNMNAPAQ